MKVFRLVTRGSYEAELVQSANLKLGLERAMNGQRAMNGTMADGKERTSGDVTEDPSAEGASAEGASAQDGSADGSGSRNGSDATCDGSSAVATSASGANAACKSSQAKSSLDLNGPLRDRSAVERMLRCGAQNIAIEGDDEAFRQFSEADIEALLESSSTTTSLQKASDESSSFSKVTFVADGEQIDMDDPEFWQKMLPQKEGVSAAVGEVSQSVREVSQSVGEVSQSVSQSR